MTFDCAAVGNPKPEMVWLNNGVAIDLKLVFTANLSVIVIAKN